MVSFAHAYGAYSLFKPLVERRSTSQFATRKFGKSNRFKFPPEDFKIDVSRVTVFLTCGHAKRRNELLWKLVAMRH